MIEKLDSWHKTKVGYATFALLELALTYMNVSLAIDRGSLWYYLLAIILFIGAVQNAYKFVMCFKKAKRV